MNFFRSKGFKPETFKFQHVTCFNTIRSINFARHYKEDIDRIGTFQTEGRLKGETIVVLKRALKVIPILSCVSYHTHTNEDPNAVASSFLGLCHIVSAPTKRVPADKVMQALFIVRYILEGHLITRLQNFAYDEVTKTTFAPKPWFDEERFFEKDAKYFTAVMFYLLCFTPKPKNIASFNQPKNIISTVELFKGVTDANFFSSAACSLYSVKKFYHGGYVFGQESIHKQKGYKRILVGQENSSGFCFRQYVHSHLISKISLSKSLHRSWAMSMIMAQGEERKHFTRRSKYCIETFLERKKLSERPYSETYTIILPEEKTPLLIQRLIEIINEKD